MAKTTGIVAELLDGEQKQEQACSKPGAFFYYSDEEKLTAGILHSCPCGCGNLGALNLTPESGIPLWTNGGSREKPTLSPSVGIKSFNDKQDIEVDGFHWHGWLRNGVWESV